LRGKGSIAGGVALIYQTLMPVARRSVVGYVCSPSCGFLSDDYSM